jgi:hypothetical protein
MVFALVSDLRRKAALNPNVEVLQIEVESGEPIRGGSIFYSRLRKGRRIIEYRSRCVRFEPPYAYEGRSETDQPFEVKVRVRPAKGGSWLTQEEGVEVSQSVLDAMEPLSAPERAFRDVVSVLSFLPVVRPLLAELEGLQRRRLAARLTAELQAWLDAIKAYLETQPGTGSARAEAV